MFPPVSIHIYNFSIPGLQEAFLSVYHGDPPAKSARHTFVTEYCVFKAVENPVFRSSTGEYDLFLIAPFYSTHLFAYNTNNFYNTYLPRLMEQPYWNKTNGVDHILNQNTAASTKSAVYCDSNETDLFQYNSEAISFSEPPILRTRKNTMPVSSQNKIIPIERAKKPFYSVFFSGSYGDLVSNGNEIRRNTCEYLKSVPHALPLYFVRFSVASKTINFQKEMSNSSRCLHIIGDYPSGKRFFDALRGRCPLIVMSNDFIIPFESLFFVPNKVFAQINMFEHTKILRTMNFMNEYVLHQFRHRYSDMILLYELNFDQNIKLREYAWAWAWSAYIRGVYSRATMRKYNCLLSDPEFCSNSSYF